MIKVPEMGILIVLFRCLQGANILVSQNNTVKLADFGAAKDKLGQVTIGEPSARSYSQ